MKNIKLCTVVTVLNVKKNEWLTHWYGLHLHPRVKVITYIYSFKIRVKKI